MLGCLTVGNWEQFSTVSLTIQPLNAFDNASNKQPSCGSSTSFTDAELNQHPSIIVATTSVVPTGVLYSEGHFARQCCSHLGTPWETFDTSLAPFGPWFTMDPLEMAYEIHKHCGFDTMPWSDVFFVWAHQMLKSIKTELGKDLQTSNNQIRGKKSTLELLKKDI